MTIQITTIKKLFKENFKGENPVQGTTEELKEFGRTVEERIRGLKNISISERFHSQDKKKRLVCDFSVNNPSGSYYYRERNDFMLMANENGELTIEHYGTKAVISDIKEIMSFISACQERVERQQAQRSKRQKVRDFKSQAIIAHVRKLAKEDKFDFSTDTDTVKLLLYIRLFENESVEIHIPFSKFKDILPELRSTISSLRELYSKGIKFKHKSLCFYRDSTGWITHESLQN